MGTANEGAEGEPYTVRIVFKPTDELADLRSKITAELKSAMKVRTRGSRSRFVWANALDRPKIPPGQQHYA